MRARAMPCARIDEDAVTGPDEPPARGPLPSDASRRDARSPRFLAHLDGDLALARSLGLGSVVMSPSWARLWPERGARVSAAATEALARVVEAVLAAGLDPVLQLEPPELPAWLAARGGWASDEAAGRFGDLAEAIAIATAGGVRHVLTLRDPGACVLAAKHRDEAVSRARGLARGHALALDAVRSLVPGARVGLSCGPRAAVPVDGARDAARVVEQTTGGAWLALAGGASGGAVPPTEWLAEVAAVAARPCDMVLLDATRPLRVARLDGGLGFVTRPAPAWTPAQVAASLASSWRQAGAHGELEAWAATSLPVASDADDADGVERVRWAHSLLDALAGHEMAPARWVAGDLLDGFADGAFTPSALVSVDLGTEARRARRRVEALDPSR